MFKVGDKVSTLRYFNNKGMLLRKGEKVTGKIIPSNIKRGYVIKLSDGHNLLRHKDELTLLKEKENGN